MLHACSPGWREKQRELAQQRDGAHRGLGRALTSIGLPRLPAQELVNIYKKFILNFEQLCVDPTVTTEMMSESVLVLYIQVEDAMVRLPVTPRTTSYPSPYHPTHPPCHPIPPAIPPATLAAALTPLLSLSLSGPCTYRTHRNLTAFAPPFDTTALGTAPTRVRFCGLRPSVLAGIEPGVVHHQRRAARQRAGHVREVRDGPALRSCLPGERGRRDRGPQPRREDPGCGSTPPCMPASYQPRASLVPAACQPRTSLAPPSHAVSAAL